MSEIENTRAEELYRRAWNWIEENNCWGFVASVWCMEWCDRACIRLDSPEVLRRLLPGVAATVTRDGTSVSEWRSESGGILFLAAEYTGTPAATVREVTL